MKSHIMRLRPRSDAVSVCCVTRTTLVGIMKSHIMRLRPRSDGNCLNNLASLLPSTLIDIPSPCDISAVSVCCVTRTTLVGIMKSHIMRLRPRSDGNCLNNLVSLLPSTLIDIPSPLSIRAFVTA
ncbi:hypothetical protein J6590_070415 [Homalodisca vitripennis]|nr:hypothetical protein J6590_070415 [Homalodisca vitripennis]